MHSRLYSFVSSCGYLNENQFGFRNGLGTADALVEFVSESYASLNSGSNLIAIFLDFPKAFDTVNHRILLQKLDHMGVRGVSLALFTSYLSDT